VIRKLSKVQAQALACDGTTLVVPDSGIEGLGLSPCQTGSRFLSGSG
jgi:hypothetical protein